MRTTPKIVVVLVLVLLAGVFSSSDTMVAAQEQEVKTSDSLSAEFWPPHLARMKKEEFGYINAELLLADAKGNLSVMPRWLEPDQGFDRYGFAEVRLTVLDPKERTLSLNLEGYEGGFCKVDAAGNPPPLVNSNLGKDLPDDAPWRVVEIVDGKKPKTRTITKERVRLRLLECTQGQKVWLSRRYFTAAVVPEEREPIGFLYNATQVAPSPGKDSAGEYLPLTCHGGEAGEEALMSLAGVAPASFNAYVTAEQANPNGKPSVKVTFGLPDGTTARTLPQVYLIPRLSEMNSDQGGWVYPGFIYATKEGELFVADCSPRSAPLWDPDAELPGIRVAITDPEKDEAMVDLTDFPTGFGWKDGEKDFRPENYPRRRWIKVTKVVIGKATFPRLPSHLLLTRLGEVPAGTTVYARPGKLLIYRDEENKFRGTLPRNTLVTTMPLDVTGPQGRLAITRLPDDEERVSVNLTGVTYRWKETAAPDPKNFAVKEFAYISATSPTPPKKGRGK